MNGNEIKTKHTNNSKNGRSFGCSCITFIFSFIIKDCLANNKNTLHSLGNNLILLALSNFNTIFVPADLLKEMTRNYFQLDLFFIYIIELQWVAANLQPKVVLYLRTFTGNFTFKLSRLLFSDLNIMKRLSEVNMWS